MHIHILGICGTFMGGVAMLAREKGMRVTGSDQNVYPPMSTQLESMGITLMEGYDDPTHLMPRPDCVIIGNALKRGLPIVETILNEGIPYQSGPQWLAEHILNDRWVIAACGTHGKTTTSSLVAWILTYAKLNPGFLIGGIPQNFGHSAQLGDAPFFVVEADEYDCAFFDKRSKFVHYRPRTCILNNLEYDHADIFLDLNSIQTQFHHLVRTVPGNGALIVNETDPNILATLTRGCWSDMVTFGGENSHWQVKCLAQDGSQFEVFYQNRLIGTVTWSLIGQHNVMNALAAISASVHAGVPPHFAVEALSSFQSVKRRMEVKGIVNDITVYDDFAHHPTAIDLTVKGLRARIGQKRLVAVLDIRSNTMCLGSHKEALPGALGCADKVYVYQSPKVTWDVNACLKPLGDKLQTFTDTQSLLNVLAPNCEPNDQVLIMSNGGFDGLHDKLLSALKEPVPA